MRWLTTPTVSTVAPGRTFADFDYLAAGEVYLDSACQTLRPQAVIDAMQQYYHAYNACGGRVKYNWGRRVDEEVAATRQKVLGLAGKPAKDYVCAFTLNTTYGLNLLLGQLPAGVYEQIITSDIEHNSVFLPTITQAKRLGLPRRVLARQADGSLDYDPAQLGRAVVVANSTSNIDGRGLANARQLAQDVHAAGGRLIIDAAQTMAHHPSVLKDVDFDAACFSSHKMYGPSLGVIVAKKDFLETLDYSLIGGGTVEDVPGVEEYRLLSDDLAGRLEAGLQDWAGIIGLGAAIDWRQGFKPEGQPAEKHQAGLSQKLFDGLRQIDGVHTINQSAAPIISFYSDKLDAHRLAQYLSAQQIMARSGYFCCHYYLSALKKYPPLLRLSLGLHNTNDHVDQLLVTLSRLIKGA